MSVKGSASREWIDSTRTLARAIPGVTNLVEEGLIDDEILRVKAQMEKEVPRFIVGTAQFVPGQEQTGRQLVADARKLLDLARAGGVNVKVEVVGHTDETGTTEFNDRLSQERAERVRSLLVAFGIEADRLSAVGVGSRQPIAAGSGALEPEVNRSVTFRVAVDAARKQN